MKKLLTLTMLALCSSLATAEQQYVCTAQCLTTKGQVVTTSNSLMMVNAADSRVAAELVDKNLDKICQLAGYARSAASARAAGLATTQCRPRF